MASRRDLKKKIHGIIDELCFIGLEYTMSASKENITKVLEAIIELEDVRKEFISRISHTEPGNVKGFYKKLYADFNAKIEAFVNTLEGLKQA